jgi:hypothetical protein
MAKTPAATSGGAGKLLPEKERRYIYGGNANGGPAGYAIRSNKKATRRRFSTFNIILLLFGLGGAIVLFINNFIAINQLSSECEELRGRLGTIRSRNSLLQSVVIQKSGRERIARMAVDQLGLKPADRPPVWFSIDREKVRELGANSSFRK